MSVLSAVVLGLYGCRLFLLALSLICSVSQHEDEISFLILTLKREKHMAQLNLKHEDSIELRPINIIRH